MEEKLEDTEGVIRSHKSYDRQQMVSGKGTKGQAMIHKSLHREHMKSSFIHKGYNLATIRFLG